MHFLLLIIRIFIIIILLLVVITKSLNSNFCAFWLVPMTRNILGYLLFCDQSQDGVCFKTFSKDEIWAINEAVLKANTKKATSFNVLGNKRDGTVVRAFSLPPMWPGFKSQHWRHMWVEFVVGSLPCSEGFFSRYSVFPSPQKPTFPNSNSIRNRNRVDEEPLCGCATSKSSLLLLLQITIIIIILVAVCW